jgi:hypothetical protein
MIHKRISKGACMTAAAAALALSAAPRDAAACGGFFCSRSPVDQTAEHILFTINDDQTVTAYVQIRYVGDKDDFAWIVPVPGLPKLSADFPDMALQSLAANTDPRYYKYSCAQRNFSAAGSAPSAAGAADNSHSGVTVLATQAVGPFQTTTLSATGADVLVQWLGDNGYRLTDKMIPLLKPYVEGGMNFVALKLQADKAVTDIKPLGMTYDGNKPMIPIRLTAIAAQPEMGIVTWILADKKWAPENYIDLKIPDSLIQFDQYGSQNNYLALVSSETDKVGGQAFVTEYAKPTTELLNLAQQQSFVQGPQADARNALLPLLQKFPYITRLYARMSAEEMTDDPTFMVSSHPGDVNNVHDLSDPSDQNCQPIVTPPPVDPCTFDYCGRRGVCVGAEIPGDATTGAAAATAAACACANDATARLTTTANGQAAMYCEPVAQNLDGAESSGQAPLFVAACEGFDCGAHGACVAMNGNPTCQCEGGYAAVASSAYDPSTSQYVNKVTCREVKTKIPALPLLPAIGSTETPGKTVVAGRVDDGGCAVKPGRHASGAAALLASLALLAAGRKRRRS